jgi:NADH-quinone oxidoreductase subunit E
MDDVGNDIDMIIAGYQDEQGMLIPILQDIQQKYNYLPHDVLIRLSSKLQIPLSRIYSVATFYNAFSLTPRGKHLVNVCVGTACHVRGAPRILDKFVKALRIREGETTEDHCFTLSTVGCLGACALAPLAVVDEKYFGKITPIKVNGIVKRYAKRCE